MSSEIVTQSAAVVEPYFFSVVWLMMNVDVRLASSTASGLLVSISTVDGPLATTLLIAVRWEETRLVLSCRARLSEYTTSAELNGEPLGVWVLPER